MSKARDANGSQDGGKPGSVTSDLAARIARARADRTGQADAGNGKKGGMTKLAWAYRLAAEFVAAIIVGLGLGWGVDQLFGTSPWGMIMLMLLGFAAGVLNVMRAAADMNAANAPPPDMPAVEDDDEDE
jgi:ATP synthase protein I